MPIPVRTPVFILAATVVSTSCSSTEVRAVGDDVLVVEHRRATDPMASTWTLSGAYQGGVTPAEQLGSMEISGMAGTGFGAEKVDPRRELQGRVDRTEPGEVLIDIRRRGLSRWSKLPINGIHPVGAGSPHTTAPDAVLSDADEEEGGFSWNPMDWFGSDEEPATSSPPLVQDQSAAVEPNAVEPVDAAAPTEEESRSWTRWLWPW